MMTEKCLNKGGKLFAVFMDKKAYIAVQGIYTAGDMRKALLSNITKIS